MKFNLTSLALIAMICFVGVGVTGCGGGGESTVVETSQTDETLNEQDQAEYEKAMMEQMQQQGN